MYDFQNEVEVKGTLTNVVFTNPHSAMHISVKGDDGATVEWKLTTGSASTLAGLGFGSGPNPLLKAGDAVTIKIFPSSQRQAARVHPVEHAGEQEGSGVTSVHLQPARVLITDNSG